MWFKPMEEAIANLMVNRGEGVVNRQGKSLNKTYKLQENNTYIHLYNKDPSIT